MRRKEVFGCLKLSRVSGRQPDWQEFIFLRNRERLLPKNAILTYMPSKLIEDGETSRPIHTSPGFVNGLGGRAIRRGRVLVFRNYFALAVSVTTEQAGMVNLTSVPELSPEAVMPSSLVGATFSGASKSFMALILPVSTRAAEISYRPPSMRSSMGVAL